VVRTADDEVETTARLRSAVVRLVRGLRRTQAGADLTSSETTVLASTVRHGPIGLSKLAHDEAMNPTMLSRVVRRLEGVGLLVRSADPQDARAGLVDATPAGRRLNERIRTERTDALNRLIEQLGPDERNALEAAVPILERLAFSLKKRDL
jgi:DNA-binding MarR family transcriptional regulator